MKTEWDYTPLAESYLKRPDYSISALNALFDKAHLSKGSRVCDVGAGVAHLTLSLAKQGFIVDAIEPNDEMRRFGTMRSEHFENVAWFEGTGEMTGRPENIYDAVTFGSSFNVTNRPLALKETQRILKPKGWFACMWNHRNLEDPIQHHIEQIIGSLVPEYKYGTRREDQTEVINSSKLFGPVTNIEGEITHKISTKDYVEAWRSHATLHRQAGSNFHKVIAEIEQFCESKGKELIVPYTTRIWIAQLL